MGCGNSDVVDKTEPGRGVLSTVVPRRSNGYKSSSSGRFAAGFITDVLRNLRLGLHDGVDSFTGGSKCALDGIDGLRAYCRSLRSNLL
jgi:hypothetical protein